MVCNNIAFGANDKNTDGNNRNMVGKDTGSGQKDKDDYNNCNDYDQLAAHSMLAGSVDIFFDQANAKRKIAPSLFSEASSRSDSSNFGDLK